MDPYRLKIMIMRLLSFIESAILLMVLNAVELTIQDNVRFHTSDEIKIN